MGPPVILRVVLAAAFAVPCLGVRFTDGVGKRELSGESFRQTLRNYLDLQYYGNLSLGGEMVEGILDTGSIELVVFSEKCKISCGKQARHYHSSASGTYRNGSLSLALSYGSGSLKAQEAYEAVAVGPLSAVETPFWEVVDADMPLIFSSEFEAIVGLGPIAPGTEVLAPGSSRNPKAFAVLLKKLSINRFSVCLGKEPGSAGYLTWNDDSVGKFPDLFTKLHVNASNYWMVRLTNVWLGDKYIGCERSCGAVLDSGTSLLALPRFAHGLLTSAVEALHVDCQNLAGLPELHFELNGHKYSLPPDSFIGSIHGENNFVQKMKNATDAAKAEDKFLKKAANPRCGAALMHLAMDSPHGPVWILGMPFFRRFYTVFEQASLEEPGALHTAVANHNCYPGRPTSSCWPLAACGRRRWRSTPRSCGSRPGCGG